MAWANMNLDEGDLVKVRALKRKERSLSGTDGVVRAPVVGDPGSVVHVLSAGAEYTVESVNTDGLTRWLCDFTADELECLLAADLEDAARTASLWDALRSRAPVPQLIAVVRNWKAAGAGQLEAAGRLERFLEVVAAIGEPDEDDAVRDVMDFVTGFCAPQARLFPE